MNMNLIAVLRRVGVLVFVLMWIPFACIFVGMAQEFGSLGVRLAQFVDGFIPGFLTARNGEASTLTLISTYITFGMMFAAMGLIFGSSIVGGWLNSRLMKTGRAATARIINVSETGTTINDNPLLHFTLEVDTGDRSPFQAQTEKVIRYSKLAQFQPGATINVSYDPDTLEIAISD
jgi:hypothetical protein